MPIGARQELSGDNSVAVITLFNNNITVTTINQDTDEHCVSVEIIGKHRFVVVNQCYQFRDPM